MTDRRVAEGKTCVPSFLLACVLWQDVQTGWQQRLNNGAHSFPALQDAIDEVFERRIGDVSGRGKLAADMREIWAMQPRFDKRTGATPFSLVAQRFRAGFDFLRLRADVGDADEALANWWQLFQYADEAQRRRPDRPGPRRTAPAPETQRPKAARKPKADDDGSASPLEAAGVQAGEGDAPRQKNAAAAVKKPVGETTSPAQE